MLRFLAYRKLCNIYGISNFWITLTPYGFWYLIEIFFGTTKHTRGVVNSLLLLPVPVVNILAVISIVVRYNWLKVMFLRNLNCPWRRALLALIPFAFFMYLYWEEI